MLPPCNLTFGVHDQSAGLVNLTLLPTPLELLVSFLAAVELGNATCRVDFDFQYVSSTLVTFITPPVETNGYMDLLIVNPDEVLLNILS